MRTLAGYRPETVKIQESRFRYGKNIFGLFNQFDIVSVSCLKHSSEAFYGFGPVAPERPHNTMVQSESGLDSKVMGYSAVWYSSASYTIMW